MAPHSRRPPTCPVLAIASRPHPNPCPKLLSLPKYRAIAACPVLSANPVPRWLGVLRPPHRRACARAGAGGGMDAWPALPRSVRHTVAGLQGIYGPAGWCDGGLCGRLARGEWAAGWPVSAAHRAAVKRTQSASQGRKGCTLLAALLAPANAGGHMSPQEQRAHASETLTMRSQLWVLAHAGAGMGAALALHLLHRLCAGAVG